MQVARELQTTVIAEGLERAGELEVLQGVGIELFEGYCFAKPAFAALAPRRLSLASTEAIDLPASPRMLGP